MTITTHLTNPYYLTVINNKTKEIKIPQINNPFISTPQQGFHPSSMSFRHRSQLLHLITASKLASWLVKLNNLQRGHHSIVKSAETRANRNEFFCFIISFLILFCKKHFLETILGNSLFVKLISSTNGF